MSDQNGVNDDAIEIDPHEVDAVAQELASSPTTNPDAYSYSYTRADGSQVNATPDGQAPAPSTPLTPTEAQAYKKVAVGDAGSTSSSSRGLTDAGMDVVDRRVRAPKDAAVASDIADLQHDRDVNEARLDRDYALSADNVLEQGRIQKEHADAMSGLLQRHQDMVSHWADMDRQFQQESAAQQAQYLHNYETQLAAARAIQVQSPYGGLTPLQAAGMSGAAFSQGFLAARYGIHIDVTSQIDNWVHQSIQQQERNKQNALDTANDQLNLWKIAKETSNSEWEARQRYRGLVIQGMQIAVQQEAARFGGDLAVSQSREAGVKLQMELDKTKATMGEQFYKDVHQIKQDALDNAYKMGTLAIQQKAEAETARHNMALEKAAQGAGQVAPPSNMNISDPEYATDETGAELKDQQGNKIIANKWRVDPNLPKEEQLRLKKEGDESRENYARYKDKTDEMMKAYREAKAVREKLTSGPLGQFGKLSWDALDRADKTGAIHKYLQARSSWVMAKVYNDSGKQINEDEFRRQENLAYKDLALAENGEKAEESMAALRKSGRQIFERHMETGGYLRVDQKDPEYVARSVPASERSAAEDDATLNPKPQVHGVADTELSQVAAKDSEEVSTKRISGTWADFQGKQIANGEKIKLGQPGYAVALDHIAAAYVDPAALDKYAKALGVTKDETPEERRAAAYEALRKTATGTSDGGQIPQEAQRYAEHLVEMLPSPTDMELQPEQAAEKLKTLRSRLTWRPDGKE
jgi:hypothetical protein